MKKNCKLCKELVKVEDFHNLKHCKVCEKIRKKAYYLEKLEYEKYCDGCKQCKRYGDYRQDRIEIGGYAKECKECESKKEKLSARTLRREKIKCKVKGCGNVIHGNEINCSVCYDQELMNIASFKREIKVPPGEWDRTSKINMDY